jgi:hypothetical protein
MNVTRAVLPVMRKQRSGLVMTISSAAGIAGQMFCTAYAAAKFGIEGWIELTPERNGANKLSGPLKLGAASFFNLWGFVPQNPVVVKGFDQRFKLPRIARFRQKRIGTQGVGPVDIFYFVQSAENDDQQAFDGHLVPYPLQNFKAIAAWHVQVEQEDSGKRMCLAVFVLPFRTQIRLCVPCRPNLADGIENACFVQAAPKEKQIIGAVVYNQD